MLVSNIKLRISQRFYDNYVFEKLKIVFDTGVLDNGKQNSTNSNAPKYI